MFGLELISPKFIVPSSRIKILHEPKDFYSHLCNRIRTAESRVFLASLYLGKAESHLIDVISEALNNNNKLHVYVLVDALRGTREAPQTCSANLLSPLAAKFPSRVRLAMYKTPKMNWLTSKLLPKRINEGVGLQHMKLYGFDNEILLSGANLSQDYFTNRQDRYISIDDKKVSDWFFKTHQEVSNLSYKLLPADNEQRFLLEPPSRAEVLRSRAHLKDHMLPNVQHLNSTPHLNSTSNAKIEDYTEVYPVCQFTPLGLGNEHEALMKVIQQLRDREKYSWLFTAGYFNVEPSIGAQLAETHDGEIILASPKANGFYGSKGISGLIPHYYNILAWKYLHGILPSRNIQVREWCRGVVNQPNGWSYHAKGLWAFTKNTTEADLVPIITYIGSSNFTRRSYKHDLECGAFLSVPDMTASPTQQDPCVTRYDITQKNQPKDRPTSSLSLQLREEVRNLLLHCNDPINSSKFPKPPQSLKDRLLLRVFGDRL